MFSLNAYVSPKVSSIDHFRQEEARQGGPNLTVPAKPPSYIRTYALDSRVMYRQNFAEYYRVRGSSEGPDQQARRGWSPLLISLFTLVQCCDSVVQ
jgi:hypothetical protein